jgi:hypothetical protein
MMRTSAMLFAMNLAATIMLFAHGAQLEPLLMLATLLRMPNVFHLLFSHALSLKLLNSLRKK